MAKRVSKARLQQLVDRVSELQNRPKVGWVKNADGRNVAQVGHIHLDHAACYGGWDLVELQSETGGAESILGNTFGGRGRLSSHELETFLLGMLAVLEPRHRQGDAVPHRA